MKMQFRLNLLLLAFIFASIAIPAAAAPNPTIESKECGTQKSYANSLDQLDPVVSEDTIEYDDGLST